MNSSTKTLHILVFLGFLLAYILPLGFRPMIIPDETRYAEIPREMISTGDWMGIAKGDGIVAVESSVDLASRKLLEHLLSDEGELLTVITGSDADDATTAAIEAWLVDEHADVQLEIHAGGQPLYPYLFGVE